MFLKYLRIFSLILFMGMSFPIEGKASGEVDFSKVVFIGDSLTAGFQSNSLTSEGQLNGYANKIAEQGGFDITLPLITGNGIPPVLEIVSLDPLIIEPVCNVLVPGCLGERGNPFEQATNLAVPGHTVLDALEARPSGSAANPLTDIVLGFPGLLYPVPVSKSQIEWAEALDPTFLFIWLGSNDVLGFAASGGIQPLTPLLDFEDQYRELIERAVTTGADIVVANITDFTILPYFLKPEELADFLGLPLELIGPDLGIEEGDLVTLNALDEIYSVLDFDPSTVLSDSAVLDSEETEQASSALNEFNRIIHEIASESEIPIVDTNKLSRKIDRRGISVRGYKLTNDFLGGVFSLDGVHPTNTGYAIIANEFIKTINDNYGLDIETIKVSDVIRDDVLVVPPFTK